jgi:hypothetical protein
VVKNRYENEEWGRGLDTKMEAVKTAGSEYPRPHLLIPVWLGFDTREKATSAP